MPLYEYQCKKDGRFELIRKFSDPPVTKCPTCGHKVEKLLSSPAIQFKGTGWYVTDYAKKGNGSSGKDGGSDSGKDSKDSGKDSGKDSAKVSGKESGKDSGKEASSSSSKDAATSSSGSSSKTDSSPAKSSAPKA